MVLLALNASGCTYSNSDRATSTESASSSPESAVVVADSDWSSNNGDDGVQVFSSAIQVLHGPIEVTEAIWQSDTTDATAIELRPNERHWKGAPRDVTDNTGELPLTLTNGDAQTYLGFSVLTSGEKPEGRLVITYNSQGVLHTIAIPGKWQ